MRPPGERALLAARGTRVAVVELQGELGFGAVEAVSRLLEQRSASLEALVLDVTRVARVDEGGAPLLAGLVSALERTAVEVVVAGHPAATVAEALGAPIPFPSLDLALEWCEDALLESAGARTADAAVAAAEHPFVVDLTETDRAALLALLDRRRYRAGDVVVDRGGPADELFLVTRGRLSVIDDSGDGPPRRAATVPAGGSFGEIGVALGGVRTATVRADTDVEVLVLDRDGLEELRDHRPRAYAAVLEQLLVSVARTATRLDREVAALAGS